MGFLEGELAKVYRTIILPVLNYSTVVYHSQLIYEQDQIIKRLLSRALKNIYGPGFSYAKMRERAGVVTHMQRRITMCDKLADKCVLSERFQDWFPERVAKRRSARGTDLCQEQYARCDRLKNSPLFSIRQWLNGKPGKAYVRQTESKVQRRNNFLVRTQILGCRRLFGNLNDVWLIYLVIDLDIVWLLRGIITRCIVPGNSLCLGQDATCYEIY